MRSKRQQTMAKLARERLVKERRARKLERKQGAAEGAGESQGATVAPTTPEGARDVSSGEPDSPR